MPPIFNDGHGFGPLGFLLKVKHHAKKHADRRMFISARDMFYLRTSRLLVDPFKQRAILPMRPF
jgi:hypothetical protein